MKREHRKTLKNSKIPQTNKCIDIQVVYILGILNVFRTTILKRIRTCKMKTTVMKLSSTLQNLVSILGSN